MAKKITDTRDLVLDSHALLTYLEGETGSDFVANALSMAEQGTAEMFMTIVEVSWSLMKRPTL